MGEPPSPPDTSPPAIPRWVKVFGVVAALVVLVFVVLLVTGGHRPRRHGAEGPTPPSVAMTATHTQLVGHRL